MIICCGEALIDMIKKPFPGSTEGFIPLPGGSPYNTAITIGRMGVPVKFLGRLSNDFFGEILIKRLQENNAGCELIKRTDQNTTLAFVKLEKGKEPEYVFYTEGTADCSFSVKDLPKKLPDDTKCILFGSISMTIEPIASTIETFIFKEGKVKKEKPVISFDPNIRSFMIKNKAAYLKRFEKWISFCTIVKISEADFEFLYPKLNAEKGLSKILELGAKLAICTLGSNGAIAMLCRKDGSIIKISVKALKVSVKDTIGAGDTFHGAFLSWLEINNKMSRCDITDLSEKDLQDALLFAIRQLLLFVPGREPIRRQEKK